MRMRLSKFVGRDSLFGFETLGKSPFIRRLKQAGGIFTVLVSVATLAGCSAGDRGLLHSEVRKLDPSLLAPFPFTFALDRLGTFFLILICSVALPVILFSISYVRRHYTAGRQKWLWALLFLFVASMAGVVAASSGFAFLVAWEIMSLASAGLILIEGSSGERRHNLFIYLLMTHAGTAAVIAAFLVFLPHAHSLDFAAIRAAGATLPHGVRIALFLLAFVGFGTKAGIIPLHLWLPRAHPIAPSPVSALMSGVMLKIAVYGFVRFAFDFLAGGPSWFGYLVLVDGAISGLLGVLYAIAEHDLKRLLAYHSVENIGIIYLGLGASLIFVAYDAHAWAALALAGALLHTLNHALFKSLLFLGAGAISDSTHTVDLEKLGGLQRRMPVTGTVFLIGCCSIIGLPLFNGFISEWIIFRSFLGGSTLVNSNAQIILPLMVGVLALIGGLAAACFVKVFGVAFLGRPRSLEAEHASEAPLTMRAGMILLAAACVVIGTWPGVFLRPIVSLAQSLVGAPEAPPEALLIARVIPWVALALMALLSALAALKKVKRQTPTWACGLAGLTSRMQYTSTAFSKPIRFVFARVYKADRRLEVLPENQPYFPESISYHSERTTSYERLLYRPFVNSVVAAANQLRRLQTGNIQVYLLYIVLTLVSLLIYLRFAG
jgi:hydrogenase-4 component B